MSITIEDLESLATEAESEDQARRAHLLRMIRAYVRILAVREPELFTARATHHGDEAGHYDSSFPPKQVYSERTGPRSIKILDSEEEDIPISGGFYYDWRRVTTYGGLYIDREGRFLRADESGTGRVGEFAAYPGDCGVDCEITWIRTTENEITTEELEATESLLRPIVFPHTTQAQKVA